MKSRDVFEDNTVDEKQSSQGSDSTLPAGSAQPGEKPFKTGKTHRPPGYTGVPGAGSNPSKGDE